MAVSARQNGGEAQDGGRRGPPPQAALAEFRLADWNVDPAANEVRRGGATLKLEPRVMAALVYLANRPGRVVTREELESAVWSGTVVGYDAVTGAIQKLRRALQDDPRQPRIIETLSKKGYRLVAPVVRMEGAASPPPRMAAVPPMPPSPKRGAGLGIAVLTAILLMAGVAPFISREAGRPGPESAAAPADADISIAVLPFDNLTGDSGQQYFVDGITDDLITDLAVMPSLLVIARDSSALHGAPTRDPGGAAHALGVRYILYGSVRRENDRVRINAHLVDTATDTQIWADRYEGSARDIFGLQDRIAERVLSALKLRLTPAERQYVERPSTNDIEAYEQYLHGAERFFRYAKASNREARAYFRAAADTDPRMARAYAMLGWTHAFDVMNGWSETPERSLRDAEDLATRALALDRDLPVAYFVRGLVHRERGEYVKALVEAERAIALNPNYANGHVLYATLLYYAGRPQEGLERMQRAIQLNPHHPFNYPFHLGQAYFVLERYDEAIAAFEQGLASNPSSERLHVWLAAAYAQSGRLDDAGWEAAQVRLTNPEFSPDRLRQAFPFSDPADLARFLEGLRKAGLSERAESGH